MLTRSVTVASASSRASEIVGDRLWIVAAGAVLIAQLWFGMISTSLWLDETGTWWIVKDGAAETIRRAWFWSGQSPLYYLLAWGSSRVFGLNETALRIPSVLAMVGALICLHRIAQRIYNRDAADVIAFVFLSVASFYAVDARPYALALFCLTASCLALLRWLDSRRPVYAALYIIASAAVVYAHCILSLSLVAGFVYAAATLRRAPRRLVYLGLIGIGVLALCLPLVPQLRAFYSTRSAHTFASLPTAGDLLEGFIPCSLIGALVLLAWLFTGKRKLRVGLLSGVWALFAPLILFLLPAFSDLRLFVDRYYSSALPGQALLVGGLLASIGRSAVRKALIVLIAAGAILVQSRLTISSHGNDDWRAGLEFIRREAGDAPVLLVSPFAEGADFRSIGDPKLSDILFAPESVYGEPANSIRLPHAFPAGEIQALEASTERLAHEHRFYIVNDKPDNSYSLWLQGRLGSRCRSEALPERFGLVWIARFTCNAPDLQK